jgi:hypothetical protein
MIQSVLPLGLVLLRPSTFFFFFFRQASLAWLTDSAHTAHRQPQLR